MKITEKQLKQIIKEVIGGSDLGGIDFRQIVGKWVNEMSNAYDEGDPSMAGAGLAEWHRQVRDAGMAMMTRLNDVVMEIEEELRDGEFYRG